VSFKAQARRLGFDSFFYLFFKWIDDLSFIFTLKKNTWVTHHLQAQFFATIIVPESQGNNSLGQKT
jgi:hypothetical protein